MNDKDKQLYEEIMKAFNDLCFKELSFDDHQRMIWVLVNNSEGFKNKPPYQKESFITNTSAGVIKGYYEYSGESEYAVAEYAETLYHQCKAELKDEFLEMIFYHHGENEESENRTSKIHNYAEG